MENVAKEDAGLCARCRHARVVVSGRGSEYWLCELSLVDSRFPRYPPLPVLRCTGFEVEDDSALSSSTS